MGAKRDEWKNNWKQNLLVKVAARVLQRQELKKR